MKMGLASFFYFTRSKTFYKQRKISESSSRDSSNTENLKVLRTSNLPSWWARRNYICPAKNKQNFN